MKTIEPKPRILNRIFRGILPLLVLSLVRQGRIKKEHLADPDKLVLQFFRHADGVVKDTHLYIAIETSFYQNALAAWKHGDRLVGIVLFATAIEQLLNSNYRFMLESRGLTADEITKIIRSNNLDAKISWLFTLITGKRFPIPTAKRLRFISETRNAIVHYKAHPDHIDNGGGSHSHIEAAIKSCKGWRLSEFYSGLEQYLLEVVGDVNPEFDITAKASQIILAYRRKNAKSE